jgi:OmpR family response regulator RpaB
MIHIVRIIINNSGQAYSRIENFTTRLGLPNWYWIDTRVVDVHITRLRSKLETDPANPELILPARVIGYMFREKLIKSNNLLKTNKTSIEVFCSLYWW